MMLLTATLSPPSCAAMLPQKFSAAATWSLPDDDAAGELPDPLQPTRITAPASVTVAARNGDLIQPSLWRVIRQRTRRTITE
jgi:hypothetical protein